MEDKKSLLIRSSIAQHRGLKGLTQKELAKKAGISKVYITSIERGKQTPSFKTIVKIANALNVDWKILTVSPIVKKVNALPISQDQKDSLLAMIDDVI